jgi:hypothetical protein
MTPPNTDLRHSAQMGARFGIELGLLLSAWMLVGPLVFLIHEDWYHSDGNVVAALFHPLAFNGPVEYILVLLLLFLSPVVPGFVSRRGGGKIMDSIIAGMIASFLIFSVTAIAGDLRMNIVLAIIRKRANWEQVLLAFAGSHPVVAYANHYYASEVPARILIGMAAGALTGAIGGLIARISLHDFGTNQAE